MIYALVRNNKIEKYPYSVGDYSKDHPQVSLPELITDELLGELGLVSVESRPIPKLKDGLQYATEGKPKLASGVWVQTWIVNDYTQAELDDMKRSAAESATLLRREAYLAEADPLFFKAQRGEATMQEWQSKIAEIKARYPKPV